MERETRPPENQKLRHWRNTKNYSQKGLADRLGVARTTYIGYESGGRMPPAYVVLRLAQLLEVPVHEIYESFEMSDGYVQLLDCPGLRLEQQIEEVLSECL